MSEFWFGKLPENWSAGGSRSVLTERIRRGMADAEMLSVTIANGIVPQKRYLESAAAKKDQSNIDRSKYKYVEPGDIVYNKMRAWQGAAGCSAFCGIVSPAYVVLRAVGGNDPSFFGYVMRTPLFAREAERWSYGITSDQWSLRPADFKKIWFPVPPLDEQRLIVRYLNHAELRFARAIQAKQRMALLLREQRAVIFDTWLVRGGRVATRSVKSEIPELGEVPEEWDAIACRYLFREVTRHDLLVTDPKLSLSLTRGLVRSSELSTKSAAESNRLSYKRCAPGDIVLNKYRAYLGAFAVATERGRITPNYTVLAPRTQLDSEYFALLYSTTAYQAAWKRESYGVGDGMMPLYTTSFYRVKSLLPPADEITRVLAGLRAESAAIDAALASVEREIALLREYRTRLIADVVTGKKDVRDEAAQMRDVDPEELTSVLAGSSTAGNDEVEVDDDAD